MPFCESTPAEVAVVGTVSVMKLPARQNDLHSTGEYF
jgi:hypothetical protein